MSKVLSTVFVELSRDVSMCGFHSALFAALFLMPCCLVPRDQVSSRTKSSPISAYPLIFEEATGHPWQIGTYAGLVDIEFDAKRSNPAALKTLLFLNAEVLYPNAEGRIKIQGQMNGDGRSFVLEHWFLAPGFTRMKFAEKAGAETIAAVSRLLSPDDFKVDVLRLDPHFSPAKYSKPFAQ